MVWNGSKQNKKKHYKVIQAFKSDNLLVKCSWKFFYLALKTSLSNYQLLCALKTVKIRFLDSFSWRQLSFCLPCAVLLSHSPTLRETLLLFRTCECSARKWTILFLEKRLIFIDLLSFHFDSGHLSSDRPQFHFSLLLGGA